jgi:hypothetical protein
MILFMVSTNLHLHIDYDLRPFKFLLQTRVFSMRSLSYTDSRTYLEVVNATC